jgi:hypothetical protein
MLMADDATQDMYGRCRRWTDGSLRGSGLIGTPFVLQESYRFPTPFCATFEAISSCICQGAQ